MYTSVVQFSKKGVLPDDVKGLACIKGNKLQWVSVFGDVLTWEVFYDTDGERLVS